MEQIVQVGLAATLVLDMKLNRLERIARCINSPILSSDVTFNQELKHCTELYFEKFVEEHTIVGEGGKKPSKTLMFVVGSPTRLGCTVSPILLCYSCIIVLWKSSRFLVCYNFLRKAKLVLVGRGGCCTILCNAYSNY